MGTLAAHAKVAPTRWRTSVFALGQTGGASLLSSVLSVIATKIFAVLLGPSQVALFATLQQLRSAGVVAGSLAGQTALVQGTSASSARSPLERREYVRTVLLLMSLATALVCAALIAFPQPMARLAGQEEAIAGPGWVAAIVSLGVGYLFVVALLNASGAIGSMALVQLAGPATLALLAYPAAVIGGFEARVLALTVSAIVAMAAALWALHLQGDRVAGWFGGSGRWLSREAVRRFATMSGSLFVSGTIANWTLIAVRARILRSQGIEGTGEFDAAWSISMNQAAFVLASMQAYYLPELSRASDRHERAEQIDRMLTLGSAAAAGLIVLLISLKPWVVTVLFSSAFTHTAGYLQWTLVGDYLKITSWILSIPLIAAARLGAFVGGDAVAYGIFLGAAVLLNQWSSAAESASMAFVLMYAAQTIWGGLWLWRLDGFVPSRRTLVVWGAGLAAVVGTSALFWRQG
jgi:O-antigen/teichoic acid export membrane protein